MYTYISPCLYWTTTLNRLLDCEFVWSRDQNLWSLKGLLRSFHHVPTKFHFTHWRLLVWRHKLIVLWNMLQKVIQNIWKLSWILKNTLCHIGVMLIKLLKICFTSSVFCHLLPTKIIMKDVLFFNINSGVTEIRCIFYCIWQ